jgi:hypothetical protein
MRKHVFSNGRKGSKHTITVLICANTDESEKMPLLLIGEQENYEEEL